jgi:hypothetical protein
MTNRTHITSRSKTALERAHSDMIARISTALPPRIDGKADASDAANRAAHMAAVYQPVIDYLETVMVDTVDRLPVARGCRGEVEVLLWDILNGPVENLAGKLLEAGCRFAPQREAA